MSARARVKKALARLDSSDLHEKIAAAAQLGALGDRSAEAPLKQLLLHVSPELRRAAAVALDQLWEPEWRRWIQGDDLDFIRIYKCANLEALRLLRDALKAADDEYRATLEAALDLTLLEFRDAPRFEKFRRAVRKALLQAAEVYAIGGDPLAIQTLKEELGDAEGGAAAS